MELSEAVPKRRLGPVEDADPAGPRDRRSTPRVASWCPLRGLAEDGSLVRRHRSVPCASSASREPPDDLGMLGGDVRGLAGVAGQVVELRVGAVVLAEQFPAPVADGEVGQVAQAVGRSRGRADGGRTAAACARPRMSRAAPPAASSPSNATPAGGSTPAIARSDGTRSIAAKTDSSLTVPAASRRDEPRPPDDQRRADAALVEHRLVRRGTARPSRPRLRAVVGADEDQGVVAERARRRGCGRRARRVAVHRLEHARGRGRACCRRPTGRPGGKNGLWTSSGQRLT